MNILNSRLYNTDINRVINTLPVEKIPHDITILVTGSTGLICSSVVDVLELLNINNNFNWKIIIAARNIERARVRFQKYESYNNVSYFEYDLLKTETFPLGIDYIIHGAGNAYPALYSKQPVETLISSVKGLENILRYSKDNRTRVLYVSSSEVYGLLQNKEPIKENEYGYVDILNPRSSYSNGKRAAETLCSSYVSEYETDCVIVRPGHIYGPTANIKDNRVSSSFMFDAAKGNDIVMKSNGEQLRSYCYCIDCASAILTCLFFGKTGEAYNISNKNSICTIKEMAEYFSKFGGVSLSFDIPSEKEKQAFNPMLNSSLNSEKIEALGWNSSFSREEGFEHSLLICRELIL
ncbi:MAG: NAD-dependent epimerase/dehydratase family protein [Treponema sp.]|nr:NAD-dependent epimerase/dehydratase family protein [Treponema sp.]